MPFPDGYAGGVYLNYEINGEARWIYLGKICNQKPSSIFKISSLKHEAQAAAIVPFGAVISVNIARTLKQKLLFV